MSGKFGYQVVETGKLPGNNWSATKDTTCAEWANSPEGKEVVEIDNFTGEMRIMPREEVRRIANAYDKLCDPSR